MTPENDDDDRPVFVAAVRAVNQTLALEAVQTGSVEAVGAAAGAAVRDAAAEAARTIVDLIEARGGLDRATVESAVQLLLAVSATESVLAAAAATKRIREAIMAALDERRKKG